MEKPPFNFEKMDKYEIPPEFVKKIEGLNLTVDDKVNFLLTKADLKPASEIDLIIKSEYESETTEHMTEEDIQKNLNIIKESGLPFQLGRREITKETYQTEKEVGVEKFYQREQMKVLIGRSKEDLDILIQALQTKSDELLGKAFGFPKTAIEAFTGKREKLDISALPQETRESDAVLFSSPFLSKDNWREEIKQGQRDADFIKKISPIIYEEMKTVSLNRETDSNENLSIEQSKETKEQQNINESEDVKGHPPIKYIDGRYICPERGWVRPEFSVGPEEYHRNLFIEYERTFGRGLAKDLSHGPLGFPSYMDDPDFEKKFNEEYGQNLKEEYRELSSKSVGYMCNGSKKVCENTIKELKEYRRKHPKMYSDVLDPNVPKKKFQIIEIKNEK